MKADVIIFVLMAVFGDVPQPEVDRACEERELALERTLEEWEREIIKAHMANDRLKAATPEERLSIPDYKKVIYSRLDSLSNKLDLSLKKVSTDAGVRLRNLKRRAGFDANILPAKKPALSVAERVAKVDNVALLEMFVMLFCTCLAHTQIFCTNTCTYLVLGEGQECQRIVCYLQQEQIILRSDNKKMMHNGRIDWPKIEITMLWSDLSLL